MPTLVRWHIEMDFHEGSSKTRAAVLLRLPDGTELRAHGHASKHPNDDLQTRVGEELAAARTLNDLARQLLAKAAHDIEESTHVPAHPAM
ncbi:hypothetical protein ABIA33_003339 [Streptacidiphilus sp. MAP12-16]|jgi:hypothetical protein|uniref:DUF1876 domain-containing protein n=1 Tax=Streptacidiphilus sp. MAP12-16 TaxID=3156300 RepID=UPI003515DAB1